MKRPPYPPVAQGRQGPPEARRAVGSALGARRFDVLLVEGKVLSAGGTDAPQALRALAQAAEGAKVMVLWAGAAEDLPALQAAGADRALLKPIDTADLVRELRALSSAEAAGPGALDATRVASAIG